MICEQCRDGCPICIDLLAIHRGGEDVGELLCVDQCNPKTSITNDETSTCLCKQDYFKAEDEYVCQICPTGCNNCDEPGLCFGCEDEYYMEITTFPVVATTCVNQCSEGYVSLDWDQRRVSDGPTITSTNIPFSEDSPPSYQGVCMPCITGCTSCPEGMALRNGSCIDSCNEDIEDVTTVNNYSVCKCKTGRYGEDCVKCNDGCKECTGAESCQGCQTQYFQFELNSPCEKCSDNC